MKNIILGLTLFLTQQAFAFVTVSPASIEFGSVVIGTSSSQMFFLQNNGNEDVMVQGCFGGGGVFQCQLNCFGTLPRGQNCMGTIMFFPQTTNYEFETISIPTSSDYATISVHGLGIR